ncbi:peptidoglycan DD-metalloendopeptidase family protein [Leadbettera azotonutricia]|uniref:LysM domain/M23/M37 peptidase domain protein n=1 Tax=Leadbettera azotonutricia (strain ATCC BAA-888 / DSM 13862 / ZAS-9) TaxID=545695 RepID=F5Y6U3_LEAAZ|nr:M23 family metallopeptidase [Leadbettera azotonutricia]AEF83216.1 LysM domain/M23/M37 peptidase domain protein [Leadbettera azotonutricia ZAS-9]
MNDFLSNQHVRRRKSLVKKHEGKPAPMSFKNPPRVNRNGDFFQQVKQRPQKAPHARYDNAEGEKKPRFSRRFSLSLPLLPAAGLFMLLLGTVLVINNRQGASLSWMHQDVVSVNPISDEEPAYDMALYAGINPETGVAINPAASGSVEVIPPGSAGVMAMAAAPLAVPETPKAEAIPLNLAETFAWETYKVKKGDSVSKIAASRAISMDAIIASNDIPNARILPEGKVIRIPNMDGIPYKVKKGDSLSKISQSMGVPLEAILDANDIQQDVIKEGETIFVPGARMKTEDLKLALGELFIYPLKGARLSSAFGWRNDPITGIRRHHAAVDLAAPIGTLVKAASDGKVSTVGFNSTFGKFIVLGHANSFQTMYAHLNVVSVKQGDQVKQGTKIGEVGNTGYSTGPHLHFAIFKNERAVNPLDFLAP